MVKCRTPGCDSAEIVSMGQLCDAHFNWPCPDLPTDPALWEIRPKFGVAGGPDELALTDEGEARAYAVGARIRQGAWTSALEALSQAQGRGRLEERSVGARIKRTSRGAIPRLPGRRYTAHREGRAGTQCRRRGAEAAAGALPSCRQDRRVTMTDKRDGLTAERAAREAAS